MESKEELIEVEVYVSQNIGSGATIQMTKEEYEELNALDPWELFSNLISKEAEEWSNPEHRGYVEKFEIVSNKGKNER